MDNRQKELSASEKLLELIRAESSPAAASVNSSPDSGHQPAGTKPVHGTLGAPFPDRDAAPQGRDAAPQLQPRPEILSFPQPGSSYAAIWRMPFSLPSSRPGPSIGIELEDGQLRLVKVQAAGSRSRLLEHLAQPLATGGPAPTWEALLDSPEFKAQLKAQLQKLCPQRQGVAIWVVLPSRHVEIVPVSIPKGLSGAEANQALYWAARKKAGADNGKIIDFTLLPETGDRSKVQALAFLADQDFLQRLTGSFEEIGFRLTGATISSLAIQNLFTSGWLEASPSAISSLVLEEEKAHIGLYFRHRLIFSREIKTGLHNLSEGGGIAMSDQPSMPAGEDIPPGQTPGEDGISEAMLDPQAVSRLVRQMERTFDHCTAHFGIPRPQHLFLSGGRSVPADFQSRLESELGIPCYFIDPFDADRLFLGDAIPPREPGLRRQLAVAVGLALGDPRQGQNFLCTSTDREEKKKVTATNALILACSLALLIAVGLGHLWHSQVLEDRKTRLAELEAQIAALPLELVSGQALLRTAATARELRLARQEEAARFQILGMMGEVLDGLPAEIKLSALTVDAQVPDREAEAQTLLQGLVTGPALQKDLSLALFLRKAGSMPLAREARITATEPAKLADQDLQSFSMLITNRAMEPGEAQTAAVGNRKPQGG